MRGVGLGLAVTPLTAAVLDAVGDADLGEASAINDAASRVGGVIAVALVPLLIGVTAGASLADALADGYEPAMVAIGGHVRRRGAHLAGLRVRRAERRAPDRRPGPRLRVARARRRSNCMRLDGQTVAVLGGTAGIGLETARLARAEGAALILTARYAERLSEVGASSAPGPPPSTSRTSSCVEHFFDGAPGPIDHVLVTGPGPYYALLEDFAFAEARRDVESHLLLPIQLAKLAQGRVRGSLLFMGGTGGRRTGPGLSLDRGADRRDAGADHEPRARGSRRCA